MYLGAYTPQQQQQLTTATNRNQSNHVKAITSSYHRRLEHLRGQIHGPESQ